MIVISHQAPCMNVDDPLMLRVEVSHPSTETAARLSASPDGLRRTRAPKSSEAQESVGGRLADLSFSEQANKLGIQIPEGLFGQAQLKWERWVPERIRRMLARALAEKVLDLETDPSNVFSFNIHYEGLAHDASFKELLNDDPRLKAWFKIPSDREGAKPVERGDSSLAHSRDRRRSRTSAMRPAKIPVEAKTPPPLARQPESSPAAGDALPAPASLAALPLVEGPPVGGGTGGAPVPESGSSGIAA